MTVIRVVNPPFPPLDPTDPSGGGGIDPNSDGGISINQQLIGCLSDTTQLLDSVTETVTNLYGLDINYWRKDFDPNCSHPIWGNQNDSEILGPYCIKAYVDIEDDSSIVSQFGIDATNIVDLQIPYGEWAKVSQTDSPLAKDLFEIKGLLDCRPSGATRAIFEVTSQGDGDMFTTSKRWMLRGARSDEYSYLVNEPREPNSNVIFTDDCIGPVDDDGEPLSSAQENPLGFNIDEIARENFDNVDHECFGGFYKD